VYRRRGKLLPIAYLNEVLQSPRAKQVSHPLNNVINIVVLHADDRQFGLVVDGIGDTQEIVVRSLGKQLQGIACYAGAATIGDGRVALILDALGIGQLSGVLQESREQSRSAPEPAEHAPSDRQTFLLFRSGSFRRLSVPLSVVARLEEIPQSKIEHAGGRRVVQYRGQILPLTSLGSTLEPGSPDTGSLKDPAQVIVFNSGRHSIGMMVDEILDIVDDTVDETAPHAAPRKGLLGSAIIAKKVTDLVDLQAIV
jgi:two-component system chemotaxis sensor kinase CheA